jgi:hypothetical protein
MFNFHLSEGILTTVGSGRNIDTRKKGQDSQGRVLASSFFGPKICQPLFKLVDTVRTWRIAQKPLD